MRDIADPETRQQQATGQDQEQAEPRTSPGTGPAPDGGAGRGEGSEPARVSAGPMAAMTAETVAAAGAALWHVGGWVGVAAGAASVAGVGAAAVRNRRSRTAWRSRSRSRSWSAPAGRATTRSRGRSSSAGRVGGGPRGRRAASRMPSLGGSRRTAGGSAGRSRSAGGGRRGTATGAGRFGGRGGARRAASYTTGTGRGAGSAAARKSAARYRRGAASAMDRVAAGALRGRAAARAARQAAKGGGGPRAASREARKALSDAHRTVPVRGAWRRTLGSAAWGAGGMCIGLLYAAGRLARQALRHLTRIQYRSDAPGAGRPRIGTTVNRPASAAGSSEGKRGAAMTVPGFVQAAEDLGEALAKYEPPPGPGGMVEMAEHLRMLPDALLQVSQGFSTFAKHCREEWPMHPAIAEFVHDLAKIQAHMAGVASEIRPAMERLHEHDFDRSRNPRPSEDRWNVA